MVQRKGLLKPLERVLLKRGPETGLTRTIGKKREWFSKHTNGQSMTLFTRNYMGLLNHWSGFLKTSGQGKRDNFGKPMADWAIIQKLKTWIRHEIFVNSQVLVWRSWRLEKPVLEEKMTPRFFIRGICFNRSYLPSVRIHTVKIISDIFWIVKIF
jgi:hypothetical protein